MTLPNLQQALAANPILAIFATLIVALLAFFAIRILFRTLGCFLQLILTVAIGVVVYLVLQNLLGR